MQSIETKKTSTALALAAELIEDTRSLGYIRDDSKPKVVDIDDVEEEVVLPWYKQYWLVIMTQWESLKEAIMPDITITLTDTQYKGLQYAAADPQDWADNALTNRARIANDEIISMYTNRALDEGVAIPATRELIVADAFTRSWAKTAAQVQAEAEAQETP